MSVESFPVPCTSTMEEGAGPDATVPKEPCDNKPTEDDIRDLLADSSPVPSPSPVTLLTSDEENGTAFDAVPKQAQPDQLDQSLSEKPEPDDAEDLFAGMDDSDGPASRKRAISEDRKEKKNTKRRTRRRRNTRVAMCWKLMMTRPPPPVWPALP